MAYEAQTILSIKDDATPILKKIIAQLELTDKAFQTLIKTVGATEGVMKALGSAGSIMATSFREINTSMGGLNTKLGNLESRSKDAAAGIDILKLSAGNFETQTILMNEKLEQTLLLLREVKLNSNIKMNMGGKVGSGGGGSGGGHGGGIGSFIGETVNALVTGQIVEQMVGPAFHPAMEFQAQSSRLGNLPISEADRAKAREAAMGISTRVPTTTPTEAMEAILQSYGISQDMGLAVRSAEMTAKLSTIMSANKSKMPGIGDDMGKITSIMERTAELTRNLPTSPGDKVGLEKQAKFYERSAKMFIQEGGTVSPEQFLQFIKYARSAGLALDEKSLFTTAPTLIQQFGQGAGQMYSQYFRMFAQGVMPKSAIKIMMELGAIDPKQAMSKGGIIGTTGTHDLVTKGLVEPNLFFRDQQEWTVKHVLTPLLKRARAAGTFKAPSDKQEDLMAAFDKLPPDQIMTTLQPALTGLAAGRSDSLVKFAIMDRQVKAKYSKFQEMGSFDDMYKSSYKNVGVQMQELAKQFQTTATIIGSSNLVMAPFAAAMKAMNEGMNSFNQFLLGWKVIFPNLAKMLDGPGGKQAKDLGKKAIDFLNPFGYADSLGFNLGKGAAKLDKIIGDHQARPDVSPLLFKPMPKTDLPHHEDRTPLTHAYPGSVTIPIHVHGPVDKELIKDIHHHIAKTVPELIDKHAAKSSAKDARKKLAHIATASGAGGNWQARLFSERNS